MTDFKAKMHQLRFRLGLRPRPRWGSLQRFPRTPSWIRGPTSKEREREGRGGEGRGREGTRGKGRGREEKEGEGREGKGHEPPPHYLEEVYAYKTNVLPLRHATNPKVTHGGLPPGDFLYVG